MSPSPSPRNRGNVVLSAVLLLVVCLPLLLAFVLGMLAGG